MPRPSAQSRTPKIVPPTEHAEQVALFQRIALDPRTKSLPIFAIPNGGHRHMLTAVKLKAEGVKAGVPDIFCAVARGGRHGLFIEMKRKGNSTTPQQVVWLATLAEQGYECDVCYTAETAFSVLLEYLAR